MSSPKRKNKKKLKPEAVPSDTISRSKLSSDFDYPIFCFKHLQTDISINKCNEDIFKEFLKRVYKLSILGWKEIHKSPRHSYGWEKIPRNQIKPSLPSFVTPEVDFLYAFRYTGGNLPFLALRNGNILHVIFIEANFGDIYDH
jgi:hypothetical protein